MKRKVDQTFIEIDVININASRSQDGIYSDRSIDLHLCPFSEKNSNRERMNGYKKADPSLQLLFFLTMAFGHIAHPYFHGESCFPKDHVQYYWRNNFFGFSPWTSEIRSQASLVSLKKIYIYIKIFIITLNLFQQTYGKHEYLSGSLG